MNDQHERAERKVLWVSAAGNLVIGCVGLIFSIISSSQAILLDGLFNLTYLATGLFTLKVARLVFKGDDERFPFGYAYFEPLVNGLKGVLVLGVSLMALVDALQTLLTGGRSISAGAAIAYGVFAASTCWLLALITRRGAKRTVSPLVQADAENWLVNGAVSVAVLLAFISIVFLKGSTLDYLVPYVDPFLVITVVLLFISIPVRMAWQALMELLNRTPPAEILQQVQEAVKACTKHLPVQQLYVRVIQPGRTRMVLAHVVLPSDFQVGGLESLDALRARTLEVLQQAHLATILDMVFTADPNWGAPFSLGAEAFSL